MPLEVCLECRCEGHVSVAIEKENIYTYTSFHLTETQMISMSRILKSCE